MTENYYYWTCRCGAKQAMTKEANSIYRQSHANFYCVHGHQSHYPEGDTTEDKLRRERDLLKQQMARVEDEKRLYLNTANDQREKAERERRRANGYKGHATKMAKRAKSGVCPCCNRTFKQLSRHMASQHPEFTPIEIHEGEPA